MNTFLMSWTDFYLFRLQVQRLLTIFLFEVFLRIRAEKILLSVPILGGKSIGDIRLLSKVDFFHNVAISSGFRWVFAFHFQFFELLFCLFGEVLVFNKASLSITISGREGVTFYWTCFSHLFVFFTNFYWLNILHTIIIIQINQFWTAWLCNQIGSIFINSSLAGITS